MITNEQHIEKVALVIEDDKSVSQLIRLYLAEDGYRVLNAEDGLSGLKMATEESPDIVLLDLNLPGMDGIEVCRNIREKFDLPIIMVTARVEEDDRLDGLDMGADDYVSKPFSPRELVARVNAVIRRTSRANKKQKEIGEQFKLGDLVIDLSRRSASVRGAEVELTPTEFRLLTFFIETKWIVVLYHTPVLLRPKGATYYISVSRVYGRPAGRPSRSGDAPRRLLKLFISR